MKARKDENYPFRGVHVKALDTLPVGIVLEFPTTDETKVPNGYMFCDGRALSRTEYSKLFGVIGTSFGSGDGSTTFNIPTKEGLVSVGIDTNDTDFNTIGKTLGSKHLQEHIHTSILSGDNYPVVAYSTGGDVAYNITSSLSSSSNKTTNLFKTNAAGTGNSGNIQPSVVTNYIIKVKETRPLASHTVNAYSESESNAYSCDYLNGKILWTNNDPTSTFANQSISGNYEDYEKFDIICKLSTSNDIRICQTIYKGNSYRLMETGYATGDYALIRDISVSNTSIDIGNCSGYGVGSNTQFASENNSGLIPLYIIGYKSGLFSSSSTSSQTRSLNTYSGDIEEKKDIVIDDGEEEKPIDDGNNENNK